jgi:uncharacterized protein YdeI (YjbR/CyaY-like superfamily)
MAVMETLEIYSKDDFRKWLERNHDKETKVGLILHKKHTGKPAPTHHELMTEAICFGWIDTTLKRVDENRYQRNFSRRTKNSRWSYNTLEYGKKLIEEGKMTPAGLKFYEEGLKKPTHDHGIPKNPDIPEDLKRALKKDKVALAGFEKVSPSARKMYYRWILRAKLKETREKRVKVVVERARGVKKEGKWGL